MSLLANTPDTQIRITKEFTGKSKDGSQTITLKVGQEWPAYIPLGGGSLDVVYFVEGGNKPAALINVPRANLEIITKSTDNKNIGKADKNVRMIFLGMVIIGLFSLTLINKLQK